MTQYPQVSEVIFIEDKALFPISWLHKQEFCEYQIFLENIKGIKVEPTKEMVEGKKEHELLDSEFREKAVPTTFEEMIRESKTIEVFSREFPVRNLKYGIYGLIDEILFTPNEFIVIDDKPGLKSGQKKPYFSDIHQIYGYCLAFKEEVRHRDSRPIVAALRERGTDNIYWKVRFNKVVEEEVIRVISHIHKLISGEKRFSSTTNPNKCRGCRLKTDCDRLIL